MRNLTILSNFWELKIDNQQWMDYFSKVINNAQFH